MKTKRVIVEEYDPSWNKAFDAIAAELDAAVGLLVLSIEHVGSTSVAGLAAKPIIDIDIVIESRESFGAVRDALLDIGYTHEGDLGITDREAFKYKGKTHLMTHHLYVCPKDSAELARHLCLRDHLRTHPNDLQSYALIKREAALLYPNDIDAYIDHKSKVIADIYRQHGL